MTLTRKEFELLENRIKEVLRQNYLSVLEKDYLEILSVLLENNKCERSLYSSYIKIEIRRDTHYGVEYLRLTITIKTRSNKTISEEFCIYEHNGVLKCDHLVKSILEMSKSGFELTQEDLLYIKELKEKIDTFITD